MALEYTFTCPLPNGVHARPASAIEEVARPFASTIAIVNQRTGHTANAKSVLGIIGADIRLNDRCQIVVAGPDERQTLDALARFFEHQFPHSDEVLPPVQLAVGERRLPPVLERANAVIRVGIGVVPGIGLGQDATVIIHHHAAAGPRVRRVVLEARALIGRDDVGHVDLVDVRAALAVDLHGHEPRVERIGRGLIAEGLAVHHVAPVARGVADREKDGATGVARKLERLVAPRVPVHGVVGMDAQVGRSLVCESVGHAGLPGNRVFSGVLSRVPA